MSDITTHVLDQSRGVPAQGMGVSLEIYRIERGWVKLGEKVTDADGRVRDFIKPGSALTNTENTLPSDASCNT